MTTEEAREYFKNKELTYKSIGVKDIDNLFKTLRRHINKACKNHEMSVDSMRMSTKIDYLFGDDGMEECFFYINSHYFKQRECISFNRDGFIGFCGWAGGSNPKPILKAFIEWCDSIEN